jgi:hypothetical protein
MTLEACDVNEICCSGGGAGGELWILSKKQFKRYDGSFASYKKLIQKRILNGENTDV